MEESLYVATAKQLIEEGCLVIDEQGDTYLTEKGKKKVAAKLDRMTPGEEVLLQIAFCEHHEVSVSLF